MVLRTDLYFVSVILAVVAFIIGLITGILPPELVILVVIGFFMFIAVGSILLLIYVAWSTSRYEEKKRKGLLKASDT